MELSVTNYHSPEAALAFWSNSQYAEFCECPARAVASIKGEFKQKRTAALAFGSLLDRAITAPDELAAFMVGPESFDDEGKSFFFDAKGKLRDNADIRAYQAVVARVNSEPLLAEGIKQWEKQRIFTGVIAGLPWKVMCDFWLGDPGCETIMDLKFLKCLEDGWVVDGGVSGMMKNNIKVPWYDANGYFRSMAMYREVVKQNVGVAPLVVLFAFTKQSPPDAVAVSFDQEQAVERFEREVERVTMKLPEFNRMKLGEIPAPMCNSSDCEYCRGKHTLSRTISADVMRMVTT